MDDHNTNYKKSQPAEFYSTKHEQAIRLAKLGFCILPCWPGTKVATTKGWQKLATTDPAQINKWWQQNPDYNIAAHVGGSGLVVIEHDSYQDTYAGQQLLARQESEPPTLRQYSASGGIHDFYQMPPNEQLTNSHISLPAGVHIRGVGGYIMLSPSTFEGKPYTWPEPPENVTIQPLPDWLLAILKTEPPRPTTPTHTAYSDKEWLLAYALTNGQPGHRRVWCYWLACRLLDNGATDETAMATLETYVGSVPAGDHPFTIEQARLCLKQAQRAPRQVRHDVEPGLDTTISHFEQAFWFRDRDGERNQHFSLKTGMAIVETFATVGRTQDVALPLRMFGSFGVAPKTAANHLAGLVKNGWLTLTKPANGNNADEYSLNLSKLATISIADVLPPSDAYSTLANMDMFRQGSKIDARLWPTEPPSESFGPACQRLIATMVQLGLVVGETAKSAPPDGTLMGLGVTDPKSVPCSGALLSGNQLYTRAGIGNTAGRDKKALLVSLGIITEQTSKTGKAKLLLLVADWLERLQDISPALNNYGEGEIRQQAADRQMEQWHGHRLGNWPAKPTNYYTTEAKAKAEKAHGRAVERLAGATARLAALNAARRAYAAQAGIGGDVPAVSLIHADRLPPQRQPVTVTGNKIVPTGHIHTGTNGPLLAERASYGPPPPTDEQLLYQDATNRAIADWNGDNEHGKTTSNEDQQSYHAGGGTRTSRAPKGVGHAARPALVPTGDDSSGPAHCQPDRRSRDGLHVCATSRGYHKA